MASCIGNMVINGYLSYTAIALNITTILALRKTALLPKPLKTLLLSLAISDLSVGLVLQPWYVKILSTLMGSEKTPNLQTTFKEFLSTAWFLCSVSFLGVVALSVDRFLAIHLHLRYQEFVTRRRAVALVIFVWVISAFLTTLVDSVLKQNGAVVYISIEALSLITTALFYYQIYIVVKRLTNQMQNLRIQQEQTENIANAARLRKSALSTFWVYVVFLACYLPDIIIHTAILSADKNSALLNNLHLWALTLVFFHSSINPLIYCWNMRHIQYTILDIIRTISFSLGVKVK